MLFQVVIENGVKKIKPLTADAGAGAPVGTIIAMYKKSSPSGYLYLDGSTFDQNAYPLLYAYLGSNVLPDYREFALVGAEENTTDVYNASTNPTGTIHDHDAFTEGQAKDDQLQTHAHKFTIYGGAGSNGLVSITNGNPAKEYTEEPVAPYGSQILIRHGTVTRGKRKAVFFYIKATSGLSENAQDNVINTLNEQRSYSTEEHLTGKKWIDGKPIYEKTIIQNLEGTNPFIGKIDVTHGIANIDTPIRIVMAKASSQGNDWSTGIAIPAKYDSTTFAEYGQFTPTTVSLFAGTTNWTTLNRVLFTLEYTKTN